jgi:hypothetical protein
MLGADVGGAAVKCALLAGTLAATNLTLVRGLLPTWPRHRPDH